jgi:hypothetical protein
MVSAARTRFAAPIGVAARTRFAAPARRLALAAALICAGGCAKNGTRGAGGSGGAAGTGAGGSGGLGSGGAGGSLGAPDGGAGDAPSHGGTITFQDIGAPGWFPSRRDPAVGPCDVQNTASCCLAHYDVAGNQLTPWDEDLIMTLRGPMTVQQLAAYQPGADAATWQRVSSWDARTPGAAGGLAFDGSFSGTVGTECLVNVSTDRVFACGSGSSPYCPPSSSPRHQGWSGSKLLVILARMAHAPDVGSACSTTTSGNWYDAPWIGLSVGELVRAGAFGSCQCYAKDPAKSYLGDGCGQFNVFEVVNDNNQYRNFDVFSTNFIGYAGYVGEGPCGSQCNLQNLPAEVDLVDKATSSEAAAGAVASPQKGPGAAFRRPEQGYRYFVILLDVDTRTVQLALIHPDAIPAAAAPLLPALPGTLARGTVDALLALRLPR